MEQTRAGTGTLKSLSRQDWLYEVSYELRYSSWPTDPLARVCVDVKRLVLIEEQDKEIPPGEYLLSEHGSAAQHRIRHLGRYIGWGYQGAA